MAPSDPTLTELPPLAELFDRPSLDDWRETATASLKGRPLERLTVKTHEGLEIAPLATAEDNDTDPGYPGQQPFVRGRTALGPGAAGWEVCQRISNPNPDLAARWAKQELGRGANSAWLVFDRATRTAGDDTDSLPGDGIRLTAVHDLDPFFDRIDFPITPVHLAAGGSFAAVAAMLVAAARGHKIRPRELLGGLDCDPINALVSDGVLPLGIDGSLDMLAEIAHWAEKHAPELRTITVSTLPYHMAGANAVQELSFALATGIEYLRSLAGRGFEPGAVCRQIGFRHAVGRDLFMEAAKLRACRRLWARAAGVCGAAREDRAAPIHAVASPRTLTTCDPWVNCLRTTVGAFAAAVGGADVLTVLPFDAAIGESDELSRRIATNSQTILREESHIGRVIDPGGGSWYLEKLTDELAQAAWEHFQAIETRGGMIAALLDGSIAEELDRSQTDRERQLATRREPITGVSSFPNLDETPLLREPPPKSKATTPEGDGPRTELARLFAAANSPTGDGSVFEIAINAAAAGATVIQMAAALRATRQPASMQPLAGHREAEIFERLRDASDVWLEDNGVRPRVFLANVGPAADHKPRATFATGFFEAGGIETIGNNGFATPEEAAEAFSTSGSSMAIICSSDARYPDLVPELARLLDQRGARTVLLAGKPGEHEDAWRSAGVSGFIHIGCDQYSMLVDLLEEEGVLHV
jgi:methylmalonyl-CoA mutase